MTRSEAISRKADLEAKRTALVDQLLEADSQSDSLSAGGGSKSFTNRSVADIKAKIAFCDAEIAKLDYRLGLGPDPARPLTVEVRFS